MIEEHTYHGRTFRVQLIETRPGLYRWVWRMDDGLVWKGGDGSQTAEVARSEAFMYAQVAIQRGESWKRSVATA